jgi:uncharacterized OsmC-like protein
VKREDFEVEAVGEIVDEDGVLVIKRISVNYRLPVPEDRRADAVRVNEVHARACPVARSIGGSIDIETRLEIV